MTPRPKSSKTVIKTRPVVHVPIIEIPPKKANSSKHYLNKTSMHMRFFSVFILISVLILGLFTLWDASQKNAALNLQPQLSSHANSSSTKSSSSISVATSQGIGETQSASSSTSLAASSSASSFVMISSFSAPAVNVTQPIANNSMPNYTTSLPASITTSLLTNVVSDPGNCPARISVVMYMRSSGAAKASWKLSVNGILQQGGEMDFIDSEEKSIPTYIIVEAGSHEITFSVQSPYEMSTSRSHVITCFQENTQSTLQASTRN